MAQVIKQCTIGLADWCRVLETWRIQHVHWCHSSNVTLKWSDRERWLKSRSSLFVVLIPYWMKHSGQTSAHVRTLYWVGDVLLGFHNQVVSHELQKTTPLSKRVTFFYNRKVNKQDALTWISLMFDKTRILPLPNFGFFNRFYHLTFQLSFAYFARERLFCTFCVFLWNFAREKLACGRPELIPSRMPDIWTAVFHLVRYPLFPPINPRINLNWKTPHFKSLPSLSSLYISVGSVLHSGIICNRYTLLVYISFTCWWI